MESKGNIITVIFTAISIVVLPICLLVMPKKDFSDNENRNLAAFPEMTAKTIASGEFMDGINDYVTDHFPARDMWISIKTESEIIIGKDKINTVWIADDGYLIGEYNEPKNNARTADIIGKFGASIKAKNEDLNIKLMLIPTSVTINSDKLPATANNASQLDSINEIAAGTDLSFVDVYSTLLNHKDEQLFYRTDHHWTTLGAYYAYVEYCKNVGFEPVSLDELVKEDVTNEFYGTYASKVNSPFQKADTITVYTNPLDDLSVNYIDTGVISDSLYDLEYVDKKDKYSLFLSNQHPLIEISNSNAETDRELMLIKDSYANSIVPFLVRHYSKIYVFDTRYYNQGPSFYLDDHDSITDVLILYNLSTIENDTGIRGIF